MKIPAAEPIDIRVRRGDTFRVRLTLKSNGVLIDLTGSTFRGAIRETAESEDELAPFTCTVAGTGLLDIEIDAATTAELPTATIPIAVYDVEWTSAAGDVKTIMFGTAFLESDVARA